LADLKIDKTQRRFFFTAMPHLCNHSPLPLLPLLPPLPPLPPPPKFAAAAVKLK